MKVCDLTQSYAPTGGGVRTYIHAKRDHIRECRPGVDHVLIVPGAEDAVEREGRCTTYVVRSPFVPGSSVYRLLYRSRRVLEILAAERPDVTEVHCAYNLPWTAVYHRRRHPRARIIGMYMTDLPRAYVEPVARRALGARAGDWLARGAERYVRALYGRMDVAVAISPALADRLREMGVERVECIPLGVDLEVFDPARRSEGLRRSLGVPCGAPLLVYAGRLDGEKRAALLMEAFERLPRELEARLVLAGDGPLRERLTERAERNGRARVIPFIQDRVEMATLLASADLYVSAMPFETFGLSVIEAQACGLPVVGVAGGAMIDRVPEASGVGRLAPVDSVEGLVEAITTMIRSGELRAARGRARAMVEASFSWTATFDRFFRLYSELLARR